MTTPHPALTLQDLAGLVTACLELNIPVPIISIEALLSVATELAELKSAQPGVPIEAYEVEALRRLQAWINAAPGRTVELGQQGLVRRVRSSGGTKGVRCFGSIVAAATTLDDANDPSWISE